ncbi:pirin family protein [Larkinella soli]|uniref:pirin family protein n=1 Tax=Larkinella soli TaxID=1770527 RepID=UPI000FFC3276|nr:pirin-like C-terminal cupin domain-containing protein [Larkinella soli]
METQFTVQTDRTFRRKLVDVQTPPPHQGFLGPDHTARAVIHDHFEQSDPFILLMDDFLDKKNDDPVGGPHPHAGFETVSLLIEGEIGDGDHRMKAGDFQMMTAGSGIVHTETIDKKSRMRLLQMWLTLPKKDRWADPRLQDLTFEQVPKVTTDGLEIRVYSGSLAGVTSPVRNHVPVIIADLHLAAGVHTAQSLPADFNAFLYVLEGRVSVGADGKVLQANQIGWLDKTAGPATSELELTAGPGGARLVLYAGQPQHDRIYPYGPFIGDTQRDIIRLYQEYQAGGMKHVLTLPDDRKYRY